LDISALNGATIAFDLDGTLVDTAPDLLRALDAVMDLEGLPRPPANALRAMVGHGARALIERAAANAGATFEPQRLERATAAFIEIYRRDIASASAPFPGVEAALKRFADAGALLAVCTNKRTDLSVELLEALGLADRFAAIVGADAVPDRKPHPDHFRAAVIAAGGEVARSFMVGDTAADVQSAQAAGRPCIVVTFGYSGTAPADLGADALIDHFDDLDAALWRLAAAAR
jgi:phosphoglycolate phosphatase